MTTKEASTAFPTWTFDKHCPEIEWNDIAEANLSVSGAPFNEEDADLIFLGILAPPKKEDEESEEEKEVSLTGAVQSLDEKLGGVVKALLVEQAESFKHGAVAGSTTPTLRVILEGGKTRRYVLVGMGSKQEDGKEKKPDGLAIGKAIATKCHEEKKTESAVVLLPAPLGAAAAFNKMLCDISTGFYQSLYSDNRYRTGKNVKKMVQDLKTVTLVTEGLTEPSSSSIEDGKKIARGVFMAMDIVNSPHNVLNSESLADTAKRIAEASNGRLSCTILGKEECEARGMGAYLGVARGSETQPQFIHLTYTPPNASDKPLKKIGIVGKGLLFDTGGYNIKTQMMELMKFDCGGGAAALGAARAVAALEPEGVEAHFIVAACENMINSKAYVPSDILTASNGKTIEVLNTDAEGRLTLADALVYADKEVGCESIIELSTLTGACIISLGLKICGLWTSNDDLFKELEEASKATGDSAWRMPMASEYKKLLESKIADLKNIGGREAGAITAALFLQNFVDEKKQYAHIDIAGPAWDWEKKAPTGFGVKLVTEWVRKKGSK